MADAPIKMKPSEWVQNFLNLQGQRFSLGDYPYMDAIYNCGAQEMGLFFGRQTSKSTTLASMLTEVACNSPKSTQVAVSPLQEQAYVFSMSRLKDFVNDSPIIKRNYFTGSGVTDQVLRKVFRNGSEISLGYASRTADRLRGRSVVGRRACLLLDEVQDIFPEVLEVLKPMAFRNVNSRYLYGGTPKSMANHMEGMRARATGNEWAVKCQRTGCKKWNHNWDERNVGDRGIVCMHCRQPLDVRPGQWISARQLDTEKGKDSRVNMVSFRVSQLIVHPIVTHPAKWIDLLGQIRTNSQEKTYNEIYGLPYDSASQPVTADQVYACCKPDRKNMLPDTTQYHYPPLVAGIDWAFVGNKSYTFVVVGGWNPFPSKFEVFYWKRYEGHEINPLYQVADIIKVFNAGNLQMLAADWGCGQVQNIELQNALGENRVMQIWHTGLGGQKVTGKRVQWEPNTRKYHLNRTAVLNDTFEHIKRGQVTFPRMEEIQTLADNILAEFAEFNDKKNTIQYTNIDPDDGLHALTYAMLAGEMLHNGDFRGHMGSLPGQSPLVNVNPMDDSAWPTSDELYQ